ncbi:MAG: L-histidine N(alpha)-methyltransferase [Alphaproteobacteria bacterium]|nr:L-histidine N(alpha)-methyltransferase [Alphaproteobacteria bacterium]MDP6517051.1 L-histidine N(alpha)-methyltransferase [Alphaproteobacteria bacterium]
MAFLETDTDSGEGRIDCRFVEAVRQVPSLVDDVRSGLLSEPRTLPPKYFYDERGSRLFDRICETPEYYPTRTEDALLAEHAETIVGGAQPDGIVELGSGTSRKTRRLLDACETARVYPHYTAFDISEDALIAGGRVLAKQYEWLNINLLVGDYEAGFANLPKFDGTRLFVFLGGTIGNFEHDDAVAFLTDLRAIMEDGDQLLLGADRVKDESVLRAAYNDRAGITAAFNLNVLRVLNAEMGADFDVANFRHQAVYDADQAQIEMHLVSLVSQRVRLDAIDADLEIASGERIRTEISRKFTPESLSTLLAEAGYESDRHFSTDNGYFSLVLASPVAATT